MSNTPAPSGRAGGMVSKNNREVGGRNAGVKGDPRTSMGSARHNPVISARK
jgi:hypothetical protein